MGGAILVGVAVWSDVAVSVGVAVDVSVKVGVRVNVIVGVLGVLDGTFSCAGFFSGAACTFFSIAAPKRPPARSSVAKIRK